MSRIARTAVVGLFTVSLTGCSLFLTRGPSKDPVAAAAAPNCTASMTWPAVDGVVAAVLTLAMISAISQDNNNVRSDDPDKDAIASGFIIAGAAGVSALIGHSRVTKCRRVNDTYMAQAYGQQQQTPYGYQQGYPQQPSYPQQQPTYPPQPTYPQQPGYPQQPYPPTAYPVQPPIARPTQPPTYPVQPPPPPATKPVVGPRPATPKPPELVLGTEGDVCTAQADCASGFTCTGNVCLKAK